MEEIKYTTIAAAVELFRQFPNASDIDVFKNLVKIGLPRQLAAQLVEFLPMAYCRAVLQNSGVRFSDSFRRRHSASEVRLLSDEPLWQAVHCFVTDEIKQGATSQKLLALAARSAEFDAVNRLLNSGSKLENIALTSPVLPWPESGPE